MTLETVARSVKDCDRFAADVKRAADEYRYWYRWDRSRKTAAARGSLRKFDKLTHELADWLNSALGSEESPERQAARKLHAAGLERGMRALPAMERVQTDLLELAVLCDRAAQFLEGDKSPKSAPRMAAANLWALFRHHGKRVTLYEKGAAAQLLVAIATAAGDRSITELAAKKFLQETRPK